MEKLASFRLLIGLSFLVLEACALTMEGVSLSGEKGYIRLQEEEKFVLECKYSLKEGETVKVVTWYHDDFMAFKWGPPESPQIGEGLEEGDAVLTRSDGNLEFAALRMGLAGKYRCEVMTSAGETYKSLSYQLLVVDMPEIPDKVDYEVDSCKIKFSWEAPAVNPKPNIVCGVWTEKLGFILTGTKWLAVPFYNGSISYSIKDEQFEILQMPLNSLIRCELDITKIDDTKVLLMEREYNFTEVWERGCAPLEVGDGVNLEYDNYRVTCHAEVKPDDDSAPVIAHVKCNEGYTPKYADFVSSVDLVCKEMQWNVGSDLTWNHFDNLVCEEVPKLPERPPPPPTKKMHPMQGSAPSGSSEEVDEEDSSAGVKILSAPRFIMLLLGVTVLSGIVLGLRASPKKKDPRFMA